MTKDDDELTLDLGSIFGKKKEKNEKKLEEVKEEEKSQYYYEDETPKAEKEPKKEVKEEIREKSDDDEVSLDLGSIFKKKEKAEKEDKKEIKIEKETTSREKEKKEDDDEVSFNLGGLFKKKEKEHKDHKKEHKSEKKEDDEVSVDLGKTKDRIAGFFRGEKTPENERYLKFGSTLLLLTLILIPLIVGTYIRMQSDFLPVTDQWAKSNIYSFVQNDIATVINSQYPNLPDANKNRLISDELSKAEKSGTYTMRAGQYAGQTIDINQQIQANSNQLKEFFKDEQGVLYTPDIDPYYWQRYTVNIVEKGHIGDEVRDGTQWDNHQLAPNGREIGKQDMLFPYTMVWFYNVLLLVNNDITVIRATQYYPVFFSMLIIILVFLIARRIAGNLAGFFAAMMVALHPAMLNRTLFGHPDSDIIVLFFSVLLTWLIFEAFSAKNLRTQVILAALAGFSLGLYSLAWSGWWYMFDFILITIIASIIVTMAINHKLIRKEGLVSYFKHSSEKGLAIITVVFVAVSGIFVTLFRDFETFIVSPFLAVIGFTNIKAPIIGSLWPNVLTTVAELNESSVQGIIQQAGGLFIFSIAFAGILFALLKKKDKNEHSFNYYSIPLALLLMTGVWMLYNTTSGFTLIVLLAILVTGVSIALLMTQKDFENLDLKDSILLAIFFLGILYAGTKGVRFVILLIPALSIGFGVSVGILHKLLTRWTTKELKIESLIAGSVFTMLFLVLFFVPQNIYGAAAVTAQQDLPIVNDAWYFSLKAIQQDSKPDAIITSWWDFGHHFKLIADRPVTFDGTTQDQPQAHWVGKLFMTDNEKQAVGILRMLNCGGNNAFDELYKVNNDEIASVKILYDLFERSREDARSTLVNKYKLNAEQTESVLQFTHCNPPESYVIASEDMIGKSGVWAHFGSWNFERAAIWQNVRGKSLNEGKEYMKTKLGYSETAAESMYYEVHAIASDAEANSWIAPWPSYAGNAEGCTRTGKDLVQCSNGVNVNLTTNDSFFATADATFLRPASFVYLTKNGTIEKSYSENVIPQHLSAMVMPVGDSYISVLSSPELVNSMFTKLFYMRGHGLKHFDMVSYQRSITGWNIFVWKVNWEGNSSNVIDEFKDAEIKTVAKQGDKVTVQYIGYFENGELFDSSIQDWRNENVTKDSSITSFAHNEFPFQLGTNAVIPGFEKNVLGMKLGEEKVFNIPPEEGYQSGELANKVLVFKVRVTKIE